MYNEYNRKSIFIFSFLILEILIIFCMRLIYYIHVVVERNDSFMLFFSKFDTKEIISVIKLRIKNNTPTFNNQRPTVI